MESDMVLNLGIVKALFILLYKFWNYLFWCIPLSYKRLDLKRRKEYNYFNRAVILKYYF